MAHTSDRLALLSGALLGFLAVVSGASSAHGPFHDYLDSQKGLDLWKTGLNYQWYHALALLAAGSGQNARRGTVICWLAGVACFTGSLYVLAIDPTQHWAGPITPLGGLLLLVGWGWLFVSLLRKPAA